MDCWPRRGARSALRWVQRRQSSGALPLRLRAPWPTHKARAQTENPAGSRALRPLIHNRVRAAFFSDLFNVVASRPAKSPRVPASEYRHGSGHVKWWVKLYCPTAWAAGAAIDKGALGFAFRGPSLYHCRAL
ncbi:protein of unknown function [Hyphomicrobium sp. 1Nfss2.1]